MSHRPPRSLLTACRTKVMALSTKTNWRENLRLDSRHKGGRGPLPWLARLLSERIFWMQCLGNVLSLSCTCCSQIAVMTWFTYKTQGYTMCSYISQWQLKLDGTSSDISLRNQLQYCTLVWPMDMRSSGHRSCTAVMKWPHIIGNAMLNLQPIRHICSCHAVSHRLLCSQLVGNHCVI